MPAIDLVPSPPTSDVDSCIFDSSSDGLSTPERIPAGSSFINVAKSIASVGVAAHSPPACFVGTPFATGTGLFEYPFPPSRPALSTTYSISSVGPPSPTTRAKYIPRIAQHPSGRRSGNQPPPVRVPPRLRTDSGGSVASNSSRKTDESIPTPKTAPSSYNPRVPQMRLRDRSGSLGVLPIQLPPPTIATIGVGAPPAGPVSPVALVGAMASAPLGISMTPKSEGELDQDPGLVGGCGKRRASVPALFAPQLNEEPDSDSGLDSGSIDDLAPSPCPTTPVAPRTDS